MKDTNEKIEKIYNDMLMSKTPEERVKMCFSMLHTARQIVLASITDKKNWRKEMFLRFYGDEFSPEQTEKFFAALDQYLSRTNNN